MHRYKQMHLHPAPIGPNSAEASKPSERAILCNTTIRNQGMSVDAAVMKPSRATS
jgi:hypothetical protein